MHRRRISGSTSCNWPGPTSCSCGRGSSSTTSVTALGVLVASGGVTSSQLVEPVLRPGFGRPVGARAMLSSVARDCRRSRPPRAARTSLALERARACSRCHGRRGTTDGGPRHRGLPVLLPFHSATAMPPDRQGGGRRAGARSWISRPPRERSSARPRSACGWRRHSPIGLARGGSTSFSRPRSCGRLRVRPSGRRGAGVRLVDGRARMVDAQREALRPQTRRDSGHQFESPAGPRREILPMTLPVRRAC